MSKRAAAFPAALALVIGGVVGFAWPAPEHPTAWTDIRTWASFAVGVIGMTFALVVDGQLRELEQRTRNFGQQQAEAPSENNGIHLIDAATTLRTRRRRSMTSQKIRLPTPAERQRNIWRIRGLHMKGTVGTLGDWELVARIKDRDAKLLLEMNRRLKDAVVKLTTETVRSRESSERLTRWLIGFTLALVILTAMLVWLTVILARKG